jgi:hypothetical protein
MPEVPVPPNSLSLSHRHTSLSELLVTLHPVSSENCRYGEYESRGHCPKRSSVRAVRPLDVGARPLARRLSRGLLGGIHPARTTRIARRLAGLGCPRSRVWFGRQEGYRRTFPFSKPFSPYAASGGDDSLQGTVTGLSMGTWATFALACIGCATYLFAMSMLGKQLARGREASSLPPREDFAAEAPLAVPELDVFDIRDGERRPQERVSSG